MFDPPVSQVSDGITHATRWLDIRQLLEEKNDPRFEVMDENDRRHVFGDLVGELRKAHEAVLKEKEREKRLEDKAKQVTKPRSHQPMCRIPHRRTASASCCRMYTSSRARGLRD